MRVRARGVGTRECDCGGGGKVEVAAAVERDRFVQIPTSLHQRSRQQALRRCDRRVGDRHRRAAFDSHFAFGFNPSVSYGHMLMNVSCYAEFKGTNPLRTFCAPQVREIKTKT